MERLHIMNDLTKRYIDEKRGLLLYFGHSDIPYGLVYDEKITADKLDDIVEKIKARMLEVIQTETNK